MSRNENGEYELVLGTPQLLSIVFILIVLMGVVFSLGYYVGRSTAPEPAATAKPPTEAPSARPEALGQPTASASMPTPSGEALEPGQAKLGGAPPEAATETGEQPQPAQPSAPASAPTPPAEAQPATAAPSVGAASKYPEPEPGQTFLQVAAVRLTEAEVVVDVLKRKGFPARVAPGPSETLFRVLVGPLKDADQIAKTRKALEEAGFRSAYVRKY